jgi:endonuclease/exonuclease/phosphatase (EEP) superfamily protein YafD
VFDLFSHFRPHYVVFAILLGATALATRAYPAALALTAVALLNGWAVRDLWLGSDGAAAAAGGAPLRVVSINVLDSNPTPGRVLDFVRDSGADLVVLVDAKSERWRGVLAALGDLYPHCVPDSWREGAPVILFSRQPVPAEAVVHPAAGADRPYVVARVAAARATPLVVGVHPTSPKPTEPEDSRERNYQLDHIGATVEGVAGPVIVAGDFNTTPWSPHFRDLLATTGLRDAGTGRGWLPTWPGQLGPAGIPIDHVLVRGEVAVTGLRRGSDVGSDHYPLIADLRVGGPSY